jgi:hypothetical protein
MSTFHIGMLDQIYPSQFCTIPFYSSFIPLNIKDLLNSFCKLTIVLKMAKTNLFLLLQHIVYWGWFEEVQIISLIQGHTHDLIDGNFAVWTMGEHKWTLNSFFSLGFFLSKIFQSPKKTASFTVLRKLYD